MLDADYFSKQVLDQINELGSGCCTLEVHLLNGPVFRVARLGKVSNGFVLLEVYPPEGVTEQSTAARRKPGGSDQVYEDRLAVPYESISFVRVTMEGKDQRFGFKPR